MWLLLCSQSVTRLQTHEHIWLDVGIFLSQHTWRNVFLSEITSFDEVVWNKRWDFSLILTTHLNFMKLFRRCLKGRHKPTNVKCNMLHRTQKDVKYEIQLNGSILIILYDVTKAAEGSGLHKRMCPSNLSQSKQMVPPRTPCSSGTGMWRKRKIFLIRNCFLPGGWEESVISCYA